MKNVFFLLAMCCAIFAHTNTYNYLVFTNTVGTKTAFGVEDLILNVDGTDLQVTNTDGTVNLILIDLASMQLSNVNSITALKEVLNADAAVQVYSVSCALLGEYDSLMEAAQVLNAGAYVISNGSVTQTVVIRN